MCEVKKDQLQPYILSFMMDLSTGAENREAIGIWFNRMRVDSVGIVLAPCESCGAENAFPDEVSYLTRQLKNQTCNFWCFFHPRPH
jgi:hypothetical protein